MAAGESAGKGKRLSPAAAIRKYRIPEVKTGCRILTGIAGGIPVPADSTDEFGWNRESCGIFLSRTQKRGIIAAAALIVLGGLALLLLAARG